MTVAAAMAGAPANPVAAMRRAYAYVPAPPQVPYSWVLRR
jgi:hypothetical protein